MPTPRSADDSDSVTTAADFVEYLGLLAEEYAQDLEAMRAAGGQLYHSGPWAHFDIGVFLDGWARWLQAMVVEGRPHYPREEIDPPSWTSLARQLDAARGYE